MDKAADSRIRVLVVDDSAFIRRAILRMFEGSPSIRIVDIASDGEMAVSLVKTLRPDVVTLDVKMPVMDGLTALARIMDECPTPVIMLSSCTGKGAEQTIRALELGAVDFVDKSSVDGPMDISALTRELTEKIMIAASVSLPDREQAAPSVPHRKIEPAGLGGGAELVLIGTSTGGPAALTVILGKVPADFRCPILIVQHMPPGFTAPLAERLNGSCAIMVKEAEDGERLLAGCAYIAPAGKHLKVRRNEDELLVRLDTEPATALHHPSVDVLFLSAAHVCGRKCLAFVLTGMGNDGTNGALDIKRRGGMVFVESEETCVVYGMPKAAAHEVNVDGTIPLFDVVDTMLRFA
jgi:two-component system, chemotaxis family, protein-glutamate methylesterase/glutaminase